jgi:hypothetical protein
MSLDVRGKCKRGARLKGLAGPERINLRDEKVRRVVAPKFPKPKLGGYGSSEREKL